MIDEDKVLVSGASQELIYRNMCCANPKKVALVSTNIMNVLQNYTVPEQLLGIAALMVLLYERYGIRPVEALNVADNIIEDARNNKNIVEFNAISQYFKSEWNV